ncbi:MAG: neutral/alkaline non-lysosomal ceramidase N-terminal domain-containing protein [Planctomycetota bacterium]|nr:neutral/alkaline non-lysosomal ceramidase N-terminal domain-containing protein [Planctomycetota bacterium]
MPSNPQQEALAAGAAAVDITPADSQFLFGYPHVKRYSTGVHDPLWATALFLGDGDSAAIFVACDIIFVPKAVAQRARQRIASTTGVPDGNVMLTATHTHSAPITVDYLSNEADPAVPKTDGNYLALMEEAIVAAAVKAWATARPAEAGLAVADATGIGTNRRDPAGPADLEVPVLLVRDAPGTSGAASQKTIAAMLVVNMHPTVLHEDSTLISGDFPGLARIHLQKHWLGEGTPVLLHTGASGNQSPRHVTRGNSFAEAERLGAILGEAAIKAGKTIRFSRDLQVDCAQRFIDFPRRPFPAIAQAEANLKRSVATFERLKREGAARTTVRTAECDWFGAEETLTLARAAADGRLDAAARAAMPAEVQVVRIGPWSFVGWPGEMFIEFALAVRKARPGAFVISMANGELQGYIVTEEAAAEGGYEASNAMFAPSSGKMLVEATLGLIPPARG